MIMRKIWNYISNLGISSEDSQISGRTIVLTNQLNFVMFFIMLLTLITTVVTLLLTNDTVSTGTLRVAILFMVNFLNLVLAKYGFTKLSRISLIFLPPIVFLLGPTIVAGYVEEESYTYYPYLLVCTSIIPQLVLHPKSEKFLFWFSLLYYFVLTVIIDLVMVHFGKIHYPIIDEINGFYDFYKIAQIFLFLFLNACIYYLRMLNFSFEDQLSKKNSELEFQNIELTEQKKKVEEQKDELITKEINTWQKLVNIITHEIVNSAIPITNLAGITGQLLEDESGIVLKPDKIGEESIADVHHGLKIIESRTQALINFVKATKSISQIPTPNIRRILIKELFARISVLYKAKFKESGIKVEVQTIPEDLSVDADLELIEQVMINLIQNSIEAMQGVPDPCLIIAAGKNETGQIQISVSDNGAGIENKLMERIFLPFYSTKNNKSGIGLSLSQQIMMQHHGRLEVNSEPGRGATFILIF
jgi:signal transduction histidine kinase